MNETALEINLTTAIVAVERDTPSVLAARPPASDLPANGLPSGPFSPLRHRTLESGLRDWVSEQTALDIGYVEQLYTFGDRGRHAHVGDVGPHVVSIGYLALTRIPADTSAPREAGAAFRPWYAFFPWEDWRGGCPASLDAVTGLLERWSAAEAEPAASRNTGRLARVRAAFGQPGAGWDEEKVLDRYELLYEAALVAEARRDGRRPADARMPTFGEAMRFDHRRILATAMGRLRGKMKYRPVVFELMPPVFTLTELQRTVEAITGRHLHKQNFRRLVETSDLVEATGAVSATAGRPAALFRFRRDVAAERPSPGIRVSSR